MRAHDILGSPPGVMLGLLIGRTAPPSFGYWLARRVARWMRRHRYEMFRTLRQNLSHVVPEADDAALDDLAEEAVFHAGCSYFDMFHYRPKDLPKHDILTHSPEEWEAARRILADERGTIVVGAHISNFDLAAQWFVIQGFEIQALSLPTPDRGDRVINTIRRQRGLIVTPISVRTLRDAVRRLKQGGIVLTGVDRPVAHAEEPVMFFDAPALLPRGHIRLALQSNARILVAYCTRQPDGRYLMRMLPHIEMEVTDNRKHDIEHNTRRVLDLIEESIRSAPEQWLMLVPAWETPTH